MDHTELRKALKAVGLQCDTAVESKLLAKHDADADGRMDLQEFSLLVDVMHDALAQSLQDHAQSLQDHQHNEMYVTGEVTRETLTFPVRTTIHISSQNPGANDLVKEMIDRYRGLQSEPPYELERYVAHKDRGGRKEKRIFLLYLNYNTWLGEDGEKLAKQVRDALKAQVPVVLAHETEAALGGCEFARFFQTTPQDLIQDKLYSRIAVACNPAEYRLVSYCLLAKELGAIRSLMCQKVMKKLHNKALSAVSRWGAGPRRSEAAVMVGLEEVQEVTAEDDVTLTDGHQSPEATDAGMGEVEQSSLAMRSAAWRMSRSGLKWQKGELIMDSTSIRYVPSKEGNRTMTIARADIQQMGATQPNRLEFAIKTKQESPDQGRSHSFRVRTRADFQQWCDVAELRQATHTQPTQTEPAGGR